MLSSPTSQILRTGLSRNWLRRIGYLLARGAFKELRDKLDPNKSNGGVLLGLNGVVVKSHGGTDALGFATAIDVAIEMVRNDLVNKIKTDMAEIAQFAQKNEPAESSS